MSKAFEGSGAFSGVAPSLVDILKTGNRPDKFRALKALAAIGPDAKSAVPTLIQFLDVQHKLQSESADVLAAIGPAAAAAVPILIQIMLRTCATYDYAHYSAAHALGRIGDTSAIPALIEAAQDRDDQGPGWRAICALANFGTKAQAASPVLAKLVLNSDVEWKGNIISALSNIGPASGPGCDAIIDWIENCTDLEERSESVYALYQILFTGGKPDSRAISIFIQQLQVLDGKCAYWSALALGHLKERQALPELVKLALSTGPEEARIEAIRSLGFIGDGSELVITAIRKSLSDQSESIRCIAAFACGWLGPAAKGLNELLLQQASNGLLNASWLKIDDIIKKINA
jgi:HEAT repeat protein